MAVTKQQANAELNSAATGNNNTNTATGSGNSNPNAKQNQGNTNGGNNNANNGQTNKSKELIAVNGKPLDFSFKNIADLAELKSIESRSGKRKPIVTENQVVVEEDKKFGAEEDETKKEGEDNEKEEKEGEENKEGEEGEKQLKDKKEEKKKQERKEPEIIRAIPSNTAASIILTNHVPLNTGATKTVGGKIIEEQKTQSQKSMKKVNSICTSLILGYNKIRSIEKFQPIVDSLMFDCINLGFLDLSHNYLQTIQYDFSYFVNLKILYLHCNYIKDLKEITKLAAPLISLTIHGNPIEAIPGFRQFIIAIIPTLKNLDTAHISKKERDGSDTNIKRLLMRVPPPVAKAPEPPQENVNTNPNNEGKSS